MAFLPYATVAEYVAEETGGEGKQREEDLRLLEGLSEVVGSICREELDFVPLMHAMQNACSKARESRRTPP